VNFVQVGWTKWLLSRSGENDVTHLQIAYRTVIGGRKRVEFFRNAQRRLADFIVWTDVSDNHWINCVGENNESVIARFYRIGTARKNARHHDEGIGRTDQKTKLFQRANLGAQFRDCVAQLAFARGGGTCQGILVLCAFQSLFGPDEIRIRRIRFLFPTITGGRLEIRRRTGPGRQPIRIGPVGIHIHVRLEQKRFSMSLRMLKL
jgi:hypothetical protein